MIPANILIIKDDLAILRVVKDNFVTRGYRVQTARSVDRCVTTLRSKIEPDPHRPTFIHTIREIGYRFEDGHTDMAD